MSDLGNKKIFAKNLNYYMEKNQKTRIDVSRDLSIPYSTITDWCNANIYPRIDKIELLANYFDIRKSDLVEDKQKIEKNISPANLSKDVATVFVYGVIPAGIPIDCIEDIIGTEEIPADMLNGGKQFFGLKVKGDSMSPEYLNGDILILEQISDCENGDDCIVIINNDEGTFKRIFKNENGIVLQPLNNRYTPLIFSNKEIEDLPVRIIGKVVELRRKK